jgi:hypothetical protein
MAAGLKCSMLPVLPATVNFVSCNKSHRHYSWRLLLLLLLLLRYWRNNAQRH